jgi:REP element-mobilizing transposase RayT
VKLHRNSPKRFYFPGATYFITMNTRDKQPFFKDDILCRLFADEIEICSRLKQCSFQAYKINPNHIHLLIKPSSCANFSEVLRSLKTNFSRNANRVMGHKDFTDNMESFNNRRGHVTPLTMIAEQNEVILNHLKKVALYHEEWSKNKGTGIIFPVFKWQPSFRDHIIRDEEDLRIHLRYIEIQWKKHKLGENKWCWISGKFV